MRLRFGTMVLATATVGLLLGQAHGSAPPGQYTVTALTVTDSKSVLTWQRQAPPGLMTLPQAFAYCEGLTLDGASDWRVPSAKELVTIVDERVLPSIDGVAFIATSGESYWSSSVTPYDNNFLSVDFNGGTLGRLGSGNLLRVRCVR